MAARRPWCSSDAFITRPGWTCKLRAFCQAERRKVVGSL